MSDPTNVQHLIQNLPCHVQLPEDAQAFFSRRGPLQSQFEEQRRFPRFYYRTEAALICTQSLPGHARPERSYRIFVKDISRSSICFLHFEQLFPQERANVILFDGAVRAIQILRCRKVKAECFEIVGNFKVAMD